MQPRCNSDCVRPVTRLARSRKSPNRTMPWILVALSAWFQLGAHAEPQLEMPACFGDNMVLCASPSKADSRRDILWGWVSAQERVNVSLGGAEFKAIVDRPARGEKVVAWHLRYDKVSAALKPSGPLNVTVAIAARKNDTRLHFTNVFLGEVWVVSIPTDQRIALATSGGAEPGANPALTAMGRIPRLLVPDGIDWAQRRPGGSRTKNWELGPSPGLPSVVAGTLRRLADHPGSQAVGVMVIPRWRAETSIRSANAKGMKPDALETAATYVQFTEEFHAQQAAFEAIQRANQTERLRAQRAVDTAHLTEAIFPWPYRPEVRLDSGQDFPIVVTGVVW